MEEKTRQRRAPPEAEVKTGGDEGEVNFLELLQIRSDESVFPITMFTLGSEILKGILPHQVKGANSLPALKYQNP